MAKIDKSQYTKEEWKQIKEQRRLEKAQKNVENTLNLPQESVEKKYYVLCLKHGTKYSADYVNRLYNMVARHCTLDYEFVCLTDDPADIDYRVKTIPLPRGISGWWCKPYMFSKDLPLNGTVLYMDLDVVIANNIDKLFTWSPGHWCTIRDFTRAMRPKWHKYNSSVVRFEAGSLDFVWTEFDKDKINIQKRLHGDQDWLYEVTHKRQGAMLYPDSWILSWKWEVRKDRRFAPGGVKGKRKLATIEKVTPRPECSICVFHGDPNPEHCDDPWVVDNWK
jgi:hypothetical protein